MNNKKRDSKKTDRQTKKSVNQLIIQSANQFRLRDSIKHLNGFNKLYIDAQIYLDR